MDNHTIAWVALHEGKLATPEIVGKGELAVFEESNSALEFEALEGARFILGSAVKHPHDLVLSTYSVHTNKQALDISRFHFARLFRESTGESPMRYLLRLRYRARENNALPGRSEDFRDSGNARVLRPEPFLAYIPSHNRYLARQVHAHA